MRTREDVLTEWETIGGSRLPLDVAAARMGMKTDTLRRALTRAKKAGDPRARNFTSAGVARRGAA